MLHLHSNAKTMGGTLFHVSMKGLLRKFSVQHKGAEMKRSWQFVPAVLTPPREGIQNLRHIVDRL